MFVDFETMTSQAFDLAIIGAGLAGMTLALEVEKRRPDLRVLVIEFGDAAAGENELDRSITLSSSLNHFDPEACTAKGVGGSSKTWGGRCVSYDETDFLPRDIVEGKCTWDLSVFNDVRRYYEDAAAYMDCSPARFTLHEVPGATDQRIADGFIEGDVLDSNLERWSLPTRYGPKFGEHLRQSPSIFVVTHCLADRLCSSDGIVTGVDVRDCETQRTGKVAAKNYVVAAGGQETTRLLLKSQNVFSKLGKTPESLGRYYSGHVVGQIATVKFSGDPRKTEFGFRREGDAYIRRRFQLAPSLLVRENLLNCAIWLDNPPYHNPSHRNGTLSMIYLMLVAPIIDKKLAPPSIAHTAVKGKENHKIGRHIANVILGIPRSLVEPGSIFVRRYLLKRKLPGVFLYNRWNEYTLNFQGEQIPRAENRMSLAADGKALTIEFGYCEADVRSVIQTHHIFDEWLRKTGAGELKFKADDDQLVKDVMLTSKDGIHQIGTTRIGKSPDDSVLDSDLRVWGVENLYCCSTTAFPTSGHANPTFLLLAFAVRLADRLYSNEMG